MIIVISIICRTASQLMITFIIIVTITVTVNGNSTKNNTEGKLDLLCIRGMDGVQSI